MADLTSEVVDLKVPDGEMSTFSWTQSGGGPRPAVIVIQEIFGVNPHIKDVAQRFANEGYFATAPDLFHRSGKHLVVPFTEMQTGAGYRQQIPDDGLTADLNAVVDYLKSNPNVDGNRIGIVGFCFGGRVSFLAASRIPAISAAAVFYGGGILPREGTQGPNLLDEAGGISCPVIGFFGDQDKGIPEDHVNQIRAKLEEVGKSAGVTYYEGAGHGFFCDERGSYHESSAKDAWGKTLAFFKQNLS